ncbi:MAG TPA: cystathionine gamma-synthase [Propionibacteriaceae bacterium]|nr:cystathionine gamma-synthase [Propionibacteriaceae bacterium]
MADRRTRITRATRAGLAWDQQHHAVVPPIYLSTTYAWPKLGESPGHEYSRSSNPTRSLLSDAVADLEGGAGGEITSSGMSALTTLVAAFAPGGAVVAIPHDCYGGTWRLFNALARKGQFELVSADFTDPASLPALWARKPALVLLESPSNPLLRVTDLAAVIDGAHAAGAVVAVDNTFLSPALQRPIELGADIVVHSTTKFLNGHSDVVGGAVVGATPEIVQERRWWANCLGTPAGALDSYLTLRGLRTLGVRMKAHCDNAQALAELLAQHPAVTATHYPGLSDDPGHDLARRQQDGFGGMLSFELADLAAAKRCLSGLSCFSLAESLGGVESLICHPASMTHAAMPPEVQAAAGISDGMLRVAVGIEEIDDLVADLRAGLDRARRS